MDEACLFFCISLTDSIAVSIAHPASFTYDGEQVYECIIIRHTLTA